MFEHNIFARLTEWHAQGHKTGLATLIGMDGSSPRPIGAQIALTEDGREAKMAEMVYAKCLDAVREVGFDKAYDKVIAEYPDYKRLVAPRGESL